MRGSEGRFPGWPFPIGAVWFDSRNSSIDKATINVTDTDIIDSSYAAVHFVSGTTRGVHFNRVNIDRTGTFALQFNDPAVVSFTGVTARNIGFTEPVYSCLGSQLNITQGAGNSGWNDKLPATYCGPWPAPDHDPGPGPSPDPTTTPPPDPDRNLAAGRPVTATGSVDVYTPAKAVDGDAGSYWESTNHAFPQSLTVDLGSAAAVGRLVLKLPPPAAWQARTQTLSVLGSADGSSFSMLVAAKGYRLTPEERQHRHRCAAAGHVHASAAAGRHGQLRLADGSVQRSGGVPLLTSEPSPGHGSGRGGRGPLYCPLGRIRIGLSSYSSRAWAIQPAVRATAKTVSPASAGMPVDTDSTASARSTLACSSTWRAVVDTTSRAAAERARAAWELLRVAANRAWARGSSAR